MKTRTAILLIFALSFLMVSAGSGSAQIGLHPPKDLSVGLDSASVTYSIDQNKTPKDTVRGLLSSGWFSGSLTVKITAAMHWTISTKIDGNAVQDGDNVAINTFQSLPVEVVLVPSAQVPDSESYCLAFMATNLLAQQCITLVTKNSASAVSAQLPIPNIILEPNPAGSYVFARGLSDGQAGYRYEIVSISGVEVGHGMLPSDARINVKDLPSGAYRFLLFDAKRMLSNTQLTVLH